MNVTKGLVIAEPWIDHILRGDKCWEMRSVGTSFRGWFGLIRKGSGTVVGIAQLEDVGLPLMPTEMIANFERHRIPTDMIKSGEVAKWCIPWLLGEVRVLRTPVAYKHRPGAVTWAAFDAEVTREIELELGRTSRGSSPGAAIATRISDRTSAMAPMSPSERIRPAQLRSARPKSAAPSQGALSPGTKGRFGRLIGRSVITEGNLKNNHFYMRSFIDAFPADTIGGSNAQSRARLQVVVDWGGESPAHTVIDGEKKFFRERRWIRLFFERNDAKVDDVVEIEEIWPYAYRVSLVGRGS